MTNLVQTLIQLGFALLFGKGAVREDLPASARMRGAAQDLEAAMALHPWHAQTLEQAQSINEKRARVVWVWSFFESAWYANPPGSNDEGRACGVMQTHMPHIEKPGTTCKAVRNSRVLGYEIGIMRLQAHEKRCGSLLRALVAYSGAGNCWGKVPSFVRRRCKLAGLNDSCE